MHDVVVIGSGFGGAVMACRLAQQGYRVLVLERGRRWQPADYPSVSGKHWFWREANPEKHNGWLDLRVFGDMSVAAGSGVGGGSLVYANVCVDAPPAAFSKGWPAAVNAENLRPYYQRVESMLKPAHLPQAQWTPRTHLMQEAAGKVGASARFRTVPQAVTFSEHWSAAQDNPYSSAQSRPWTNAFGQPQGTCVHCGHCDTGCAVRAKNTLDLNYIPLAEQHGAEVRALHHVRMIAAQPSPCARYRVSFRDLVAARDGYVDARHVVVAAGSIGSTELLLRCRDQHRSLPRLSARLGKGWSANGDFVTPAFYPVREVSPTRGPTISACIDFLDGDATGGRPLFIEDGGFPDVPGNFLEMFSQRVSGRWQRARHGVFAQWLAAVARRRDPLAQVMPWFGQCRDEANGELFLGRPWFAPWRRHALKMHWDYRPNEAVIQAISNMHHRLSTATGGVALTPPSWSLFRNLVTPHPLGGCAMGEDELHGVVDHRGAVFNYPGLYVVDGAMVPASLGINPSKTIAALAERAAELFSQEQ
jgi:cholesterol oxidase